MGDRKSILALEGSGHGDTNKVPTAIAFIAAYPDALGGCKLHSFDSPDSVGSTKWHGCVYILVIFQLTCPLGTKSTLAVFHCEIDRDVPILPVLELEDLAVVSSGWITGNWWL